MGMFSGRGELGAGKHRAFSVLSESRASDIMLRFHDCCKNYKVELQVVGIRGDYLRRGLNEIYTRSVTMNIEIQVVDEAIETDLVMDYPYEDRASHCKWW